jgi:hypothetical protein
VAQGRVQPGGVAWRTLVQVVGGRDDGRAGQVDGGCSGHGVGAAARSRVDHRSWRREVRVARSRVGDQRSGGQVVVAAQGRVRVQW